MKKADAIALRNALQSDKQKLQRRVTDLESKLHQHYVAAVLTLILSHKDKSSVIDVTDSLLSHHLSQDFSDLSFYRKKSDLIPALTALGYFVTEYDSEEFPPGETPITVYAHIPMEWDKEYIGGGEFRSYTQTSDGWLHRQCGAGPYFKNHDPTNTSRHAMSP